MDSPPRLTDLIGSEEIQRLNARSDLAGAWAIASTWGAIALALALLALLPHPLTFVLAVVIIGGRQLALAVLMHEASHRSLFKSRWGNEVATDWLCARPIWNDVARYRAHHMKHHAHTGTERDPDMSLVRPFPTTRASMARKFLRDITGLSGLRRIVGLFLMDIGYLEYSVAAEAPRRAQDKPGFIGYLRNGARNLSGVVLTNLLLAGSLAALGHAWLYWAWVAAWMTSFSLFIRIRSIAEHACMEQSSDPWRNTRTTHAGWLARLTVAAMQVNFHREHHLAPSVPCRRLPELHDRLRALGQVDAPGGYREVLAAAATR